MLFLFICNVFFNLSFSYIVDTLKLCIFLYSIFLKLQIFKTISFIFSFCFSNFLLFPALFFHRHVSTRDILWPPFLFYLLLYRFCCSFFFLFFFLRLFPSLVVRSPAYAVNMQVVLSRVSLNKVKCWLVQNTCKDYEEHVKWRITVLCGCRTLTRFRWWVEQRRNTM